MKKNLLGWFALATMLVGAGCSSDEVVNDYSLENAIQFGTYMGRNAEGRGVILDNDNITNFGVFASYTGQTPWTIDAPLNFMFNQQVNKSGDTWGYTPLKYWPTTQNDKISFFAYAPHKEDANTTGISLVSDKTANGIPVVNYEITETNLTKQADFTADVIYNQVRNSNLSDATLDSYDQPVYFTLLHELTRVNIYAKLDRNAFGTNDANKTKVNVKMIEVVAKGQFNTKADYTFASPENNRGTWSNFIGATANLELDNLMNDVAASDLGGYTTTGVLVSGTTSVSIFDTNQYLFLIPSNGVDGLENDGDITLRVSYDIVTVDDALANGYSVTPAVKDIPLCKGELKQGVAYVYTLIIGLNEIKLSANVAAWDEAGHFENVDWTDTDVLP